MILYLIRHGQTEWNATHRAQGHTDIPLDTLGLRQAESLWEAEFPVAPSSIWSSDLLRASQTARPLAQRFDLEVQETPRLRERSFGEWEGQTFDVMDRLFRAAMPSFGQDRLKVVPPGGESFFDLIPRLTDFLSPLKESDSKSKAVAIVTHGGTCSVLLSILLAGDATLAGCFKFSNCSVTEVHVHDERNRLVRYNDVRHGEHLPTLAGVADGSAR